MEDEPPSEFRKLALVPFVDCPKAKGFVGYVDFCVYPDKRKKCDCYKGLEPPEDGDHVHSIVKVICNYKDKP